MKSEIDWGAIFGVVSIVAMGAVCVMGVLLAQYPAGVGILS